MSTPRTHIFSGSVYEEMAGYARAVVVGDRIFVSGTVGVDFATGTLAEGAAAQTAQALETIDTALRKAGSELADIVRLRVYVPDPEDVMAVSGVLKATVGFTFPANTTLCAPLAVPGAQVEIEAEAIRGSAAIDRPDPTG
ncbi:MAG: Rid family hydrolase [Pseudomonadota bacterium]